MHLSWLDPHKMRKMTVVGREKMVVFDDMELERKVTVYEKGPWEPAQSYGEWRTRTGDIFSPKIPNDEPLRLELQHFLRLVAEGPGDHREATRRARSRAHARPAHDLAPERLAGMSDGAAEIHPSAIVYPGTVLGEGVKVLENAVVGKQPTLSPRSTAKREPLPPTVLGAGTIVSTGAIVFAGSTIGDRVILGDQSCVRERVTIGDDVVVGRGSLVENDTTIGAHDEDPGRRLHHRLLDARGARLHRPVRRDDERQLDGPHREALRQHRRARRSAAAPAWAAARSSAPGSRSARRRSSAPARSSRRTCRRARWSSAAPHAFCARCPRTSCCATAQCDHERAVTISHVSRELRTSPRSSDRATCLSHRIREHQPEGGRLSNVRPPRPTHVLRPARLDRTLEPEPLRP